MKLIERYGPWACVAGAAEGLGKAFSEQLSRRGFNVIMIDREQALLEESGRKIQERYANEVVQFVADLNDVSTAETIFQLLEQKNCRFLVYNAAYGPVKPFVANKSDEIDRYLNVNARTMTHLIHSILQTIGSKEFGVLLISSLAGWRGTQFVIPYAATKAYIWNLAEGLHYEFKNTGFTISVCVAGMIDTPNFRATNPQFLPGPKPMLPEAVARETLNKFGKKLFIVPGRFNKLIHFILQRVLPRKIASALHNNSMKKMYS